MPVQWQNFDLPLGQGMNDNDAKTALPPGRPRLLINGQFNRRGGIAKRMGFDDGLGTSALGTGVGQLMSYRDRLLYAQAGKLYDFASSIGNFEPRSTFRSTQLNSYVAKSSNVSLYGDTFSCNGFTCFAWTDGTGKVQAQILDENNNVTANANSDVFGNTVSAVFPQVLGFTNAGTIYFIVIAEGHAVRCRIVGNLILWDNAPTTIFGGAPAMLRSRAIVSQTAGCFVVAATEGTGLWFGQMVASTMTLTPGWGVSNRATAFQSPSGNQPAMAIVTCTSNAQPYYLFAYINSDTLIHTTCFLFNGTAIGPTDVTLATVPGLNQTVQHITGVDAGGGYCRLYYDNLNYLTPNLSYICAVEIDRAGVYNVSAFVFARGLALLGDAYKYTDGHTYIPVEYCSPVTAAVSPVISSQFPSLASQSTLNSAVFVIDENGHVCARGLRDSAVLSALPRGSTSVYTGGGDTGLLFAACALSQAETATIQSALALTGVALVRFALSSEQARGVSAFRNFVSVGGSPATYDGSTAVEENFHVYPEIVDVQVPGSGGSFSFIAGRMARATHYLVGDTVGTDTLTYSTYGGHIYMCVQEGTTSSGVVVLNQTGGKTPDGTAVWLDLGFPPPSKFRTGVVYNRGQTVVPSTGTNGYLYSVSVSDDTTVTAAEPVWPTHVGVSVTNGTYTYKCVAKDYYLTAKAGYTYAAVYSWVDDNGQLHRSAASVFDAATLPTSDGFGVCANILFVVTTLRLTDKSNVRIEIYRTAGNGTVLQQIASLANDPTIDYVGFVDRVPDTTQALGAVLYQGSLGAGEYPNRPPPSCSTMAVFNQRLVCNNLENPFALCPSKLVAEGYGAAWADELVIELNGAKGAVTAITQMDDALVVFQESGISVLEGDGPDNTGAGVAFSSVRPIATDVGCTQPQSLVATPVGVLFQSSDSRGIYLLGRDYTVRYVGEAIRNDFVGDVISAIVDPYTPQAIFVTSTGGGSSNVWVYDWGNDAWSFWTLALALGDYACSIGSYGGVAVVATANGAISRQLNATTADVLGDYGLTVWLAPVRLDGVQGYAKVRSANLLWDTGGSDPTITVDVYESDSDAPAYTLDPVVLSGAGDSDMECRFRNQKQKLIGLQIRETVPTEAKLVLEGVTFRVGIEGGTYRVAPNKRAK